MAIKNIIFDMGGVIIDYSPRKTLSKYFSDGRDVELIMDVLYGSGSPVKDLWGQMDIGAMTSAQVAAQACLYLPERLREKLTWLLLNWWDEMPPFPAMCEFIRELKEKGFGIYLLSNTPEEFHERKASIPAFQYFDGFIASCDHQRVKPGPEIFRILFDTFSLDPAECYFIDDLQRNIDGAAAVGMKGHCYAHGDVDVLRRAMIDEGIF
ncbi:MAG: HAD family phosphatase [Oscillospiraceae bacterium]|nr:HAD family phosphatase [Oscillospiraceae bacterium]